MFDRIHNLFAMLLLALGLTLAGPAGCGDEIADAVANHEDEHDEDHDDEELDEQALDEEACEHLAEGPFAGVNAATTVTAAAAAAIDDDHTAYVVALTAVAGGSGGMVSFAAGEAAEFLFFLDADVGVTFLAGDGSTTIPAEASEDHSEACGTIKDRHLVDLEVGTTYLDLGPAAVTDVAIVVEEAGGEHEEHADDDDHEDD